MHKPQRGRAQLGRDRPTLHAASSLYTSDVDRTESREMLASHATPSPLHRVSHAKEGEAESTRSRVAASPRRRVGS